MFGADAAGGDGSHGIISTLAARTVTASNTDATATAAYRIGSDGISERQVNLGAWTDNGVEGISPVGAAQLELLEVMAATVSGTAGTGTVGAWIPATGLPAWVRNRTTSGTVSWVISVQFRRKSDHVPIGSAQQITLSAEFVTGGGGPVEVPVTTIP